MDAGSNNELDVMESQTFMELLADDVNISRGENSNQNSTTPNYLEKEQNEMLGESTATNDGSSRHESGKGETIKYNKLEDIIDAIGGMGPFQIILILLTSGSWMIDAMTTLMMAFAAKDPGWWCIGEENGYDVINMSRWNSTYQQCTYNNTECRNIVFDDSMVTVVTEFELVCDRSSIISTIITAQMVGVLVGAVVMAQLADIFGRKYLFLGSLLMLTATNLGSALVGSWRAMVACRVFTGLSIGGVSTTDFILPIEFTGRKYRYLITMIPFWVIGETIFGVLAYALEDYRHICFTTAAIGVPYLMVAVFFVPESLRWLVTQSRTKEAEAIVKRISWMNGKKCPPLDGIFHDIGQSHTTGETRRTYTYRDLMYWVILKKLLVCMFISFTLGTCWYGIAFGLPELAGNIYINLILSGAASLPASPIASILMQRFGRRFVVCLFSVTGLCATTIVVLKLVEVDSVAVDRTIVACVILGKGMLEVVWNAAVVLETESFPTVIRSLAFGVCNTSARIGGIFGPVLLYLKYKDGVLMYVVVAVLTFVGSGVVWLVPETRGVPLADHI